MRRRPASLIPIRALRACALACALVVGACGGPPRLVLHYRVTDVDPSTVASLVTSLEIVEDDPRGFRMGAPPRAVADGVAYSVEDTGGGELRMIIRHDAAFGFVFRDEFEFDVTADVERPPDLSISALALGGARATIAAAGPVVGHFGQGARVDLVLAAVGCNGQVCALGEACCDGACTTTEDDPAHCGACGRSCAPGEACLDGRCRCQGGSACAGGQTCCDGIGCVALASDPKSCGGCATPCPTGFTCEGGACRCGTATSCASDVCCGGTTPMCSPDQSCPCGTGSCAAPNVCCDAVCVDSDSDPQNCGACGKACAAPMTCSGGRCTCAGVMCAAGDSCCPSGCRNLTDDPKNCGACGKACQAGERCVGGSCVCGTTACAAGKLCCNDACVAPDASNCGACGKACNAGEACQGSPPACACGGGAPCLPGQACCGSSCHDLATDNDHCGNCTTACAAGSACIGGACKPTACVPACTNGNSCVPPACKCGSGPACTGTQYCCNGTCVERGQDPANCGTCGNACASDKLCCGGSCVSHSVQNCAACGQACAGDEQCRKIDPVWVCRCGTGPGCTAPKTCCGNTCRDVNTDPLACGGCDVTCGARETCSGGTCACGSQMGMQGQGDACGAEEFCARCSGAPVNSCQGYAASQCGVVSGTTCRVCTTPQICCVCDYGGALPPQVGCNMAADCTALGCTVYP